MDDKEDLYRMLGLQDLRWRASQQDIKKAYRQCVLKYHPDKLNQQEASKESGDQSLEEALSNAMAVLSDPQKRRAYDSKDMQADIDDSVPADKKPKDDEDFFKTWGPVLDRNARWSLKPLPSLGDAKTPIETVLEVYEAWFNFESWRDFTNDIEEAFDLDEASCREERRWMERQNKKQAEKLKKDETRRINMIIETCHKWDPRIQKYKEDLKNAKKASKQAKYADQRKAEEEAKKRAEEEAAAKKKAEEEEAERRKIEKEAKDAAKKSLKRARKALRDAAETAGLDGIASVKVQEACEASDKEEAGDSLLAQLKQKKEGSKERKWSREEMDLLHKALIRYPAGTSERWTKIAQSIGTRSDAECQRKCHELKNNFSANAAGMSVDADPAAESDWSVEQQRALEAAMAEFKSSTLEAKEKWKAIAEKVPGKSDKDCIRRVKEIKAMLANKGSA
ncbi:hypothetical protein GUITHDRAFT_73325 [Guillardia theta CCMP2712]|uniref:DnaJ homolog subfamily C member 2 n=1 Tax=Guillardia theta (strain CCMP2712) TaxID=905079 RepID=L1J4U4_GUITC|nr:hypothetical protein GUITHDRAFT_73325 [Guillardia theta CCMP2712]EKX43149.1 hypothetical protein GUITHDRAFT_73325 [Guillardia theta CCMP2712]|eukprot:XP_005830129.1 hypothetical protein GUITHDRAFT_73325 [Guillardia theta CCMP2712]